MTWDDRLARLLEDLEQQADGLAMAERDAQVAELSRAEYAQVDLAGRLHASVGRRLQVTITGAGTVDGSLARVGQGWCLLEVGAGEWIVRLPAIGSVRGLSDRSLGVEARSLGARLGVGSALRGVGGTGGEVVVVRLDGGSTRGSLGRVGADFVDLRLGEARSGLLETVPFATVAAVRTA
jgi:hypothetical protein